MLGLVSNGKLRCHDMIQTMYKTHLRKVIILWRKPRTTPPVSSSYQSARFCWLRVPISRKWQRCYIEELVNVKRRLLLKSRKQSTHYTLLFHFKGEKVLTNICFFIFLAFCSTKFKPLQELRKISFLVPDVKIPWNTKGGRQKVSVHAYLNLIGTEKCRHRLHDCGYNSLNIRYKWKTISDANCKNT